MKESDLWRLIRDKIKGHIVRVENAIGTGLPDVNACYNGNDVWIELKLANSNRVTLRSTQLIWFMHRLKQGGRVKLLYRSKDELGIIDGRILEAAKDRFKASVIDQKFSVNVRDLEKKTFSKPYDWEEINQTIFDLAIPRNTE